MTTKILFWIIFFYVTTVTIRYMWFRSERYFITVKVICSIIAGVGGWASVNSFFLITYFMFLGFLETPDPAFTNYHIVFWCSIIGLPIALYIIRKIYDYYKYSKKFPNILKIIVYYFIFELIFFYLLKLYIVLL